MCNPAPQLKDREDQRMTTFPAPGDPVDRDPVKQAISALTEAARQTRIIGQGTAHESTERVDFGEIVCQVVTSVAANLGGTENLLAGRPGSWEASFVRQIIQSTAGEDPEELLSYRTEPVRLSIDALDAFEHFGIDELYEEAIQAISDSEVSTRDTLFEALATDSERARLNELIEMMPEPLLAAESERGEALENMQERFSIIDEIEQRAIDEGNPLAAALTAARNDGEALEKLYAQDQASYSSAFLATLHQALSARHLSCGIEVIEPVNDQFEGESLREQLEEYARVFTPLPMTGEIPDWTEGKPADALRRSGLTYAARVQSA